MKNKETREKRGIVPMLSAVAAVLGIATASFVFAAIGGTAGTAQNPAISVTSETTTTTEDTTPTATPTDTPTDTPATETTTPSSDPKSTGSNTGSTKPSTGSTGSKPSSGSNSGSGNGTSGGGATTPKPTNCPSARSEDPATWDACRAGYVAPKIEFAGLVSCVAADSTKQNWRLTYAFRLSGGNYKGYDWDNSNGQVTILVKGYPIDGAGDTYPLMAMAEVWIYPMNGLKGVIDDLTFDRTVNVPTGQYCK